MISMDDFIKSAKQMMETDLELIEILKDYKDELGITPISQTLLSKKLRISQSNVSYRLRRLIKYGAIEKVRPGQYRIISEDVKHTPYGLVFQLIAFLENHVESYRDLTAQSEALGVKLSDIQQAWGFINNSFKY